MLFAKLLINLKFSLSKIALIGANVSLTKAIANVRKIGAEFASLEIFGDRFGKFVLIGVEIAQLEVRFGHVGVDGDRFLEQGVDLKEIESGIFFALPFPQAQGVVVLSTGVVGLKFGKAAESLNDFVGLGRRAIECFGKEKVAAGVGRIKIGSTEKGFHGIIVIAAGVVGHAESDDQAR